jgi:hypothetical protein
MKKIWYVSINNTQEGPYSVEELKRDDRITPDTLAWKEGFPRWIPIRDIPELRKIFKDEERGDNDEDENEKKRAITLYDEVALAYQQDPNSIFWLIVVILALIYSLYQFYVFT